MKKTVITVIRIIVIVAILGLLTYGGFVGMNRVSGTGDYTIDQYAVTDDGGLLTVTKGGRRCCRKNPGTSTTRSWM